MNYLKTRRLLGAIADQCPSTNKIDVERMIKDSAETAYHEDLDCLEQKVIRREAQYLQDIFPGLGKRGSLELLAALSEFLPERSE